VVANFRKEGVESRHEFLRVLVEVGPAAKPVVGDLVAFLAVRNVAFDEEIPKTLDQLDAGWREHPSVKTVLPELMKRLDADPIEYRALVAVGEPVIPELLKALEGTSRGRETAALIVLGKMGASAKKAVPGIAKRLADPMRSWVSIIGLLTVLKSLDLEWA